MICGDISCAGGDDGMECIHWARGTNENPKYGIAVYLLQLLENDV